MKPYRMPDEGAPGPLTRAQRMDPISIGSAKDLRRGDRQMLNPVLEPVPGEEVGMEEKKSKVYKKRLASGGSASSRADGCVQRGKTRGKFV